MTDSTARAGHSAAAISLSLSTSLARSSAKPLSGFASSSGYSARDSSKPEGTSHTYGSVRSSVAVDGTSVQLAKGIVTDTGDPTTISSSPTFTPPAPPTSTDISNNTVDGATEADSFSAGVVAGIAISTFIIILLPVAILCMRRQHTVHLGQRTKWWKRRRPLSKGYDDHSFLSEAGNSSPNPTPTPQWVEGSHIYRPGDPPATPEENEIYLQTVRSRLALEDEELRPICPSTASTFSRDSMKRSNHALQVRQSRTSLPSFSQAVNDGDKDLLSVSCPSTPSRTRTISLR